MPEIEALKVDTLTVGHPVVIFAPVCMRIPTNDHELGVGLLEWDKMPRFSE